MRRMTGFSRSMPVLGLTWRLHRSSSLQMKVCRFLTSGSSLHPAKQLLSRKAVPKRENGRLGAVSYSKLVENRTDVIAHSPLGQVQALGDLDVAQPACEKFQDIALTLR